jgi:hypothetical protein
MSYSCAYLAASLPMIFFGDPPPFSSAEFRRRCEGPLPAADLAALDWLLSGRADEAPRHPFVRAWNDAETQLRNALAWSRAAAWGVDAKPCQRLHGAYRADVRKTATDAWAKADPLERERELDRGRWRLLDEWSAAEPFGPPAVLAYGLKLRIAERWAGLKDEDGAAALASLAGTIEAAGRAAATAGNTDRT